MSSQAELEFLPSAPISGETLAVVESVGKDWRADGDWNRFTFACLMVALDSEDYLTVDPNQVRERLTKNGELCIQPRRYSAFWHRAASKDGFLDFCEWVLNTDVAGGNNGKPLRSYRLRDPNTEGES